MALYQRSKGLESLPPYLFADIERKLETMRAQGVDIIPMGIGDPDIPTPSFILDAEAEALREPYNHQYPTTQGEGYFREAVGTFYKKRFNVDVDPATQVCSLIGSKEGIANISRAFIDPGHKVLVPDPAYPVYGQAAALLNNAEPVRFALTAENNFLPDLDELRKMAQDAQMMYLNYPNNPTAAVCDNKFLEELATIVEDTGIILCYDNAYSEFTFDDYKAPSILEFTDRAIEFHSLSKTFNMTGHRIGWAIGHPELVGGLKGIKSQLDSGAPRFVQEGGRVALEAYDGIEGDDPRPKIVRDNMLEYQRRRDHLRKGLRDLGFDAPNPKATFYMWVPVNGDSRSAATAFLEQGVVVTPGVGFGQQGEGFIRFALTQSIEVIEKALGKVEGVKAIEDIGTL